jgi:hypothetical protein
MAITADSDFYSPSPKGEFLLTASPVRIPLLREGYISALTRIMIVVYSPDNENNQDGKEMIGIDKIRIVFKKGPALFARASLSWRGKAGGMAALWKSAFLSCFFALCMSAANAACESCDSGQVKINGACAVPGSPWMKVCLPGGKNAKAVNVARYMENGVEKFKFVGMNSGDSELEVTSGDAVNWEVSPWVSGDPGIIFSGAGIMPYLKHSNGDTTFIFVGDRPGGLTKFIYSKWGTGSDGSFGRVANWTEKVFPSSSSSAGYVSGKWNEYSQMDDDELIVFDYMNNNLAYMTLGGDGAIKIVDRLLEGMQAGGAKRFACDGVDCFVVRERCSKDEFNVYKVSMTGQSGFLNSAGPRFKVADVAAEIANGISPDTVDFATKGRGRIFKYCNGKFLMASTGSTDGILGARTDSGDVSWKKVTLPAVAVNNKQGFASCGSGRPRHEDYGGYAGLLCWENGFYLIAAKESKAFYSMTGESGSWAEQTMPGQVHGVVTSGFYADNFFGFLAGDISQYAYITRKAGQIACMENKYLSGTGAAAACVDCPLGTYSPVGSTSPAHCGKKLHFGNDMIYLGTDRDTTPALRLKSGAQTYFGHMSIENKSSLKTKINGIIYSIYGN